MEVILPQHSIDTISQEKYLSFATNLLFELDHVRENCAKGLTTQNQLMSLIKNRIEVENNYAMELSRIANISNVEDFEYGTMKDALCKLKAQYLNTSVQHQMLAKSLQEDVLKPIEGLYATNSQKAINLNKLIHNLKKQAKVTEDTYRKYYTKFDTEFRDASMAFAVAIDAGYTKTHLDKQYRQEQKERSEDMERNTESYVKKVLSKRQSMDGNRYSTSPASLNILARGKSKSSVNNNSQKLVSWLLSTDQQKKGNVATGVVDALMNAEKSRKKCQQSWEAVEQGRIDMYRCLQSILTEYQQMFEHRISNLATNLRKHVVFESSALANEQYDWQMIAGTIENVDFEGDIRDFILKHQSYDLNNMNVNDLCNVSGMSTLILSPSSNPSRPVKNTPLQLSDLASRKIPFDIVGNQEPLCDVLVTGVSPNSKRISVDYVNEVNEDALETALMVDLDNNAELRYRVRLAQDVGEVIAQSYEIRAIEKTLQKSRLSNDSDGLETTEYDQQSLEYQNSYFTF